jgi:FixJ family two-component response regulator
LTPREQKILTMIWYGLRSRQIADRLRISVNDEKGSSEQCRSATQSALLQGLIKMA